MTASSPRRHTGLIRALQYFEAVARHGSVGRAANELGVSQSAVSHQLRDLTTMLGEQLVTRAGRGIMLTGAGERLAAKLGETFQSLHDSIEAVVGSQRSTLRVAVCSSFGPHWLIPRLSRFIAARPDVDLQLRLYATDPLLTDQVADAIVSAVPMRPGYTSVPILEEMLVAVEAPGSGPHRRRLITTDTEPGELGDDWQAFSRLAGTPLAGLAMGGWMQATHFLLALEMARAGLGAALVPDFVAERDLKSGALVQIGKTKLPSGRHYKLCFKVARSGEAALQGLVQWLKAELSGAVIPMPPRAVKSRG